MPPALILALALDAQAPADDAADLAGRVASADPAAREEAEGRLEEVGPAALPALRIAAEKAEDPVAGRRLADLIDLIERRRLLRATPVVLDLKDVPVAEAVAELSRVSGLRVALDPPDDPAWARRSVSLATRGPIGFWEAIDRLGAAGGFRVEPVSFWAELPEGHPGRPARPRRGPAGPPELRRPVPGRADEPRPASPGRPAAGRTPAQGRRRVRGGRAARRRAGHPRRPQRLPARAGGRRRPRRRPPPALGPRPVLAPDGLLVPPVEADAGGRDVPRPAGHPRGPRGHAQAAPGRAADHRLRPDGPARCRSPSGPP